jgi:hypothetical protein
MKFVLRDATSTPGWEWRKEIKLFDKLTVTKFKLMQHSLVERGGVRDTLLHSVPYLCK